MTLVGSVALVSGLGLWNLLDCVSDFVTVCGPKNFI